MSSFSFDVYLKSIQKNLQKGSERSHYPALKDLLDDPAVGIDAVIEEKGNKAGIPDFTVKRRDLLVGYVEAKDVGLDLDQIEKSEQLQRYLEAFPNLVLTNYLEFRWYVNGKRRLKEALADRNGNKLQVRETNTIAALLDQFLNYTGEIISSPEDLARQMARLTKAIKLATSTALGLEESQGELHQLKQGFSEVLLPDLNDADFADMYAQTISYGLFAARVGHAQNSGSDTFTRRTAGTYIPATNPFLKRLFNTIVETDAISQIDWAIDDLVQVLSQVDMGSILEDFGRRTRQEDPVVHFYETFLAAYNAALRKSRGVYYTPEPVVSFIVRSVDAILKDRFDLPLGLADNAKDPVTQKPRVQILDPATGTGTFLYEVVKQIYRNLEEIGMANQWDSYVKDNLLNRLFGFELLMAPYAIAHLKLGLQLQELGYQFKGKQRLGIYLTNTLDEALKKSEILFGQFVAQEANEASVVKKNAPIMVILGNPPYSGSSQNASKRKRIAKANESYLADIRYTGRVWEKIVKTAKKPQEITELTYIGELLERYKGRVRKEGEKNISPLDNDYLKFICFAHHRVEQTGYGVVGYITASSYLNGLIHRGVREELLKTFDQFYVMDLHGIPDQNCPDGSPDRNVFDIKEGVSIVIGVKDNNPSVKEPKKLSKVAYYDLWGKRQEKYNFLSSADIESVEWQEIQPLPPNYFFAPKDFSLGDEYQSLVIVTDIFSLYKNGIQSGHDDFAVSLEETTLTIRLKDFYSNQISNSEIQSKYGLKDKAGWVFEKERNAAITEGYISDLLKRYFYRPFDNRWIYFSKRTLKRPVKDVMQHLLQENTALILCRQQVELGFDHVFVTNLLGDCNAISIESREFNYYFPLYLHPDTDNQQGNLFAERSPNFSLEFIAAIREKLGYVPTPETIFYYIYAIFHSPTYRQRYAEFLKIDFPRVPLTSNDQLFKDLGAKGEELVALHLMKSKKLNKLITILGGDGDNAVTEVTYKPSEQRIYINKNRYFEGITPDVWEFKIGGYQVLDKWLKDRKKAKRTLSFDDVLHYQKVVVALKETMQTMQAIDQLIPGFPIK
ncbi:type ISP restriction/modification enzyme [Phormidesmis sp. 146-12]